MLPDSCNILFKFNNYPEFSNALKNKSLAWQDLRTLQQLRLFDKYILYFDSLISVNNEFKELTENNPVYFGVYPGNRYLVALNVKELADEKLFSQKLNVIKGNASLHLTAELRNGIIAISNRPELIESLFSTNTAKLANNKNFSYLTQQVDYNETSIYIGNHTQLNQSISALTIKPESISLNGIKLKDTLSFYGDGNAGPLNSYEFLEQVPLLCNAFEIYAIGKAQEVLAGSLKQDWWEDVNEAALFNAKKQFYENIGNYLINVTLPSKNHALVVPINDTTKLTEILPFMIDSSLSSSRIHALRKTNADFFTSTFPALKLKDIRYVVNLENRVVFTATEADAELFLNARQNNSSILKNSSFNLYASKNFDTDYHYLAYCLVNSTATTDLPFNGFLSQGDAASLRNLSHYSFSCVHKNNFTGYRLNLKYFQEDILDEPSMLWTMNVDTGIITQPFLFKNHSSGATEIAFQTRAKELFLQSSTGKTLWKRTLNEEIRSDIYVVDAFKNGKFQMLFNTDHYLHLVDRNGNYVQGYPVKLPAKATNKLAVFDYEKKNDLRLFIACADNKIYNYTIWGVKHEGFRPYTVEGEVTLPVKYCKVGLSDYLITADTKGKIYAFSRKGDGRIDFKNKLIEHATNFEMMEGSNLANTQIVYYDEKNNLINKIFLTDKKEVYKTGAREAEVVITFADADHNTIKDLVVSSPSKTEVYDLNGTKIFSTEQSLQKPASVSYYQLNTTSFITVLDGTGNKLFVITPEQNKLAEYAATRQGIISALFNDGKPYLLVVAGNKLKCYKL